MWAYDNNWKSITCRLAQPHNVLLLGKRDMFEPKLDEIRIWAKRPPIVTVSEVVCKICKGKSMEAGGKVKWKDGAWWERRVNFVNDYGLTIVDSFWQPVPDEVILQFYLRSNKLILEDNSIVTADNGEANVRIPFVTIW